MRVNIEKIWRRREDIDNGQERKKGRERETKKERKRERKKVK